MNGCLVKMRKTVVLAIDTAGCLLLLSIALLVFVQVVMRKVFNSPLGWTEEVVRIFLVWVTFLGSFVAMHKGQHLLMSVVTERLPERRRRYLSLLTNSMLLLLLAVVVYYGAAFIAQMGFIPMPVTGIKNFYVFGVMWISFLLMLLETIMTEFEILRGLQSGERKG